jgi:MFS family permease
MSLPLCYCWNLLNFFSVEISSAVLITGEHFDQKMCLLAFFTGTSIGDVLGGVITQIWQSRRRAMVATLLLGMFFSMVLLVGGHTCKFSAPVLYAVYFLLGLASGCWALATMITAEHFGTNIRATTSLIMLNFLRGFTIPMVLCFQSLREHLGVCNAALLIGVALYPLSFMAIKQLQETHGRDLDYVEPTGATTSSC